MFQSVGHTRRGDRRRQAGALVVSILVGAAGVGGLLALGGRAVAVATTPDEAPIDVLYEPILPATPAPAAAPPPPRGRPDRAAAARKEAPVAPPPATDAPAEDAPQDEEVDASPAAADAGEPGGGEPSGSTVGRPGGVVGSAGATPGADPGGPPTVPWTRARIRRTPPLDYPAAAAALGLGEVRCLVRYFIDERGRPTRVDIEQCPAVFHPEIRAKALRARFEPFREAGVARPAQFLLGVTFLPR